jgi:hypothetical protein
MLPPVRIIYFQDKLPVATSHCLAQSNVRVLPITASPRQYDATEIGQRLIGYFCSWVAVAENLACAEGEGRPWVKKYTKLGEHSMWRPWYRNRMYTYIDISRLIKT